MVVKKVRSKNEPVLTHDYCYVSPLHFKNRQIPMLFDGLVSDGGRVGGGGYLAGLLCLKN